MFQINHYLQNKYKINGRVYPHLDCWGLIVYYYKNELEVTLNEYTDFTYKTMTCGQDKELSTGQFKEINAPVDDCVVTFSRERLFHVGIFKNGKILHTHQGGTKYESIESAVKFQNVKLRFYEYVNN